MTTQDIGNESADRLSLPMFAIAVLLAVVAWWLSAALTIHSPPGLGTPQPLPPAGRAALAVTTLTIACWILRAMPIAPASLLPLALFPILGVAPVEQAARAYADPILWMFFGGFLLALAIERCGLHRRIALRVLALLGTGPRRLVLGFALAGTILSMWINNTATTLALLPIGWAVVTDMERSGGLKPEEARRFGTAMMLAIAYGSSVGGVGTPIGTAPNLLFFKTYGDLVQAGAPPFAFLDWLLAFVPFAFAFTLLIWFLLVFVLYRLPKSGGEGAAQLLAQVNQLPRMSSAERRVAFLFVLAVVAWVTRGDISIGGGTTIQGWASRVGRPGIQDGTVAVVIGILAFLIPSGGRGSPPLMDWKTGRRMPFEILFLLGGGVAIADALGGTGVSESLGAGMAPVLMEVPPWLAVAMVVALLTFLTEVASNTAITVLMLPLLLETARLAGMDPRLLLLPATIAASCAFMMPIGTPPNAIVFASGKVRMGQMAFAGFWLDLVSIVLLTATMWYWALPILDIVPGVRPPWLR